MLYAEWSIRYARSRKSDVAGSASTPQFPIETDLRPARRQHLVVLLFVEQQLRALGEEICERRPRGALEVVAGRTFRQR
jgi:hypothetical protein